MCSDVSDVFNYTNWDLASEFSDIVSFLRVVMRGRIEFGTFYREIWLEFWKSFLVAIGSNFPGQNSLEKITTGNITRDVHDKFVLGVTLSGVILSQPIIKNQNTPGTKYPVDELPWSKNPLEKQLRTNNLFGQI